MRSTRSLTGGSHIQMMKVVFIFISLEIMILYVSFRIYSKYSLRDDYYQHAFHQDQIQYDIRQQTDTSSSPHELQFDLKGAVPSPSYDGTFMNQPIVYRPLILGDDEKSSSHYHSTAHCLGDNFSPPSESWKYKSCQFQHLCFDTTESEFVLFASPEQIQLEHALADPNLTHVSTSTGMMDANANAVSIGGINPKWYENITRMRWFPRVLNAVDELYKNEGKDDNTAGIYELPDDVVLVPFHSMAGHNVGHLIWDDWLPLYTILSTFDLIYASSSSISSSNEKERERNTHLFVRYILKGSPLWAGCDWKKENLEKCNELMKSFLPLLLGQNTQEHINRSNGNNSNKTDDMVQIWTTQYFNLSINKDHNNGIAKSKYVCSKTGAAGFGMLTDHGTKTHGWGPKDYETSHNLNRGESLYNFRNFMINNIGVSTKSLPEQLQEQQQVQNSNNDDKKQYKIVFSVNSSSRGNRMYTFGAHIDHLKKSPLLKKYNMEILTVRMSKLSVVEQIELMSSTSILVTVNGGGAVTTMFLPKGASALMYFNDEEGHDGTPARLDWDLINQLGYIRTHWLPRFKKTSTMPGSSTGPLSIDFESLLDSLIMS